MTGDQINSLQLQQLERYKEVLKRLGVPLDVVSVEGITYNPKTRYLTYRQMNRDYVNRIKGSVQRVKRKVKLPKGWL